MDTSTTPLQAHSIQIGKIFGPEPLPAGHGERASGARTRWSIEDWLCWPPDLFALTSTVLRETGAYRLAVSPRRLTYGPALDEGKPVLRDEWFRWILHDCDVPRELAALRDSIFSDPRLAKGAEPWQIISILIERYTSTIIADPQSVEDLLRLHAYADMVCDGFGVPVAPGATARSLDELDGRPDVHSEIHLAANMLLESTGTLSRLSKEFGTVLPKIRTAQRGLTLRSLSHYLTHHRSEVDVRWRTIPWINQDQNTVNILAVPWPFHVEASAVKPCGYPLDNPDPRYAAFEYDPGDPLDIDCVIDLYREARKEATRVHVLVFPELALTRTDLNRLQAALEAESAENAPMIIAGVRGTTGAGHAGAQARTNHVSLSVLFAGKWYDLSQHKHHRWTLDGPQIRQYALGGVLDASRKWWEAIDIPPRTLTFLAPNDWLTLCPLICEDLAQLEPVSEVIRGVGPTLVIALLMDGPQLPQRWSARYVGVLADDPGTSVLTLTSLGMASRSRAAKGDATGRAPESRVVSFWKDHVGGTETLELGPDGRAVLLTISAQRKVEYTADGRSDAQSAFFTFQGSRELTGDRRRRRKAERPREEAHRWATEIDARHLTVFSFFVDAVLDAPTDTRKTLQVWVTPSFDAQAPPGRQPFQTIWKRVSETVRGSEHEAREFGSAVATLDNLIMEFEKKNGSSQPLLARWEALVETAAERLRHIDEDKGVLAGPVRIERLVCLLVLWAVHNRAHRHSGKLGRGNPGLSHALRCLRAKVEGLLAATG